MALDVYKTAFDNAYQEIFQKTLVGLKIANLRFEPVLRYGETVQRALPNIDNVRVRDTSRGSASTVDAITDTSETLDINLEKETVFHLSDGEVTQCGPLNPGEYFGGKIAQKVSADLDGRIFAEVLNASYDFDAGDLTTAASTGTSFALTSTTVPQMVTRMPAKLVNKNKISLANMAFVIDSYAAADIAQYLLGKQFDVVESVFKNGYAGNISTAEVYISENLTSEVVFTITAIQGTETPYLEINGIKIRWNSGTLISGDLSVCPTATATNVATNLCVALNNPYTSAGTTNYWYALSATSAAILAGSSGLSANSSAGVVTIRAIGGGRMAVAENISGSAFASPFLHCYYGKKGAIDVVVQDLAPVDMRKTDDRRGTNVFSSYLAGIKTFTDGSKKFLDVIIDC